MEILWLFLIFGGLVLTIYGYMLMRAEARRR